jgi:hypothetical protein
MEPRISLVTLGVADVARATAFYQAMGFVRAQASNDRITFMQAGGVVLSLFGRRALADDAQVPAESAGIDSPEGFSGMVLAHNVRSGAEVDAVLLQATQAGATLRKPAQKVFWGGYSGHFADLDGHLWEVAHNPYLVLDDEGIPRLDLPVGAQP